jgi:hypothetical protein
VKQLLFSDVAATFFKEGQKEGKKKKVKINYYALQLHPLFFGGGGGGLTKWECLFTHNINLQAVYF